LSDWESFIAGWRDPDTGEFHQAPADSLRVQSLDILFRKFLQARYSGMESLNEALGRTTHDSRIFSRPSATIIIWGFCNSGL
jgi:hypothetical protein